MKISVITVCYNNAATIRETLGSVCAQSWPDIEYVVVDGASTDGTLELIRAIPRAVTLVENVRGGISRAMNVGIDAATGDVIAFLHADDYYVHPQVLERVACALEETGADWLFGRCLSDIEGKLLPEGYTVPRYSYRRLLKGNFIPHPATFVRRRLFDQIGGFDEKIKYAMDYDMWLRLGRLADPAQLDEHLSVFRRHPGSLSTCNRAASFQDDFSVRMKYASRAPWSRAYHWAHYFVRRRRLESAL